MRAMCAYVPKTISFLHAISFLRANVPRCQRRAIFQIGVPTCQKRANISFLRANVPKTCHFSNWRTNVPKGVPIFQLFFKRKNVSIMVNICKFQEYLGNSRKFISRSKEFETKYFDICLFLPCTPQIFLKKHTLCKMITKLL